MIDSLPLSHADAALRGVVVALLVLLAGVLRRDRPRLPAARIGVVLTLALCVQVVASTPLVEARVPRLWQAPLVAVSVANAALFWIFVQALLDDEFTLRPRHIAAWIAAAALGGLNCAVGGGASSASIWPPLTLGLQRAVPLLFALLAAIAAASHWRADLVEGRRRLRGFIVVAGIAYTLAMLVARVGSPQGRLSAAAALLDMGLLFGIVAVVAGRLLRLGGSDLFPLDDGVATAPVEPLQPLTGAAPPPAEPVQRAAPSPPDPAEERLARALRHAMTNEHVYRTEDLTVAALAARLAVPEYRLRRHINQRLGHRNFNAYVNAFRLADARSALADPLKRELPILTVALDAGFQSIGPFNRAFKAATGLTPGDFRREKLADS